MVIAYGYRLNVWLALSVAVFFVLLASGCTREVVKEVPKEVVVEKEVVKVQEVPVEVVVEREVVKEIPVQMVVEKEVVREVPKEVVVQQEVVREVTRDVVIEKEGDPGELVIYSGRSESLVDNIIQQFAEATGIDVEVRYANTGQLAATLLEEGGNSPADIFFAQDPGGLGAVETMLVTLSPNILEQVPGWAQSPQGKWVGISGRARTVVYNSENLTEADLPDDMFGFTDSSWKDRIGWAPTNASFQTMVTAMRAQWGEEKTRQWLQGVSANDPKVYPKNTPQVAAVAAGEIDVGFVNHYYLFRFLAEEGENFPARNYHPRSGGPGSIVMVAGAGILASAENRENAERFLQFMLSPVAQQYFAGQTFEYPLVDGVKTQRVLVPVVEIVKPNLTAGDLTDLAGTQALLQDTGVLP